MVLILGLLARKDVGGVMAAFAPAGARLIATGFSADAACDPQMLAEAARAAGMAADARADPASALEAALTGGGPAPHVVICGSLYLAGEVLAMSRETWPS